MVFTRRTFLATTTMALLSGQTLHAADVGIAFLVLQDIPADWTTGALTAVLEILRKNKLPAILVSSDFLDPRGTEKSADNARFREAIKDDLIEVVPTAPEIYREQRLFHLRAANEFRRALSKLSAAKFVPAAQPVTYFEQSSAPLTDLSAYRSAGFRVRIVCPEANASVDVVAGGRDQLSISGGQRLDLFDPAFGETLAAWPVGEDFAVLHLSLAGGAYLSHEALVRAAEASVGQLSKALLQRGYYASLARDFFLLGGKHVPRDLGLLLDVEDSNGKLASFAEQMKDHGLPFSRMTSPTVLGNCSVVQADGVPGLADCVASFGRPLELQAAATVVVGLDDVNGLSRDVRMHFSFLESGAARRFDRLTLADSDRVLRIGIADVGDALARDRLLRQLKDGQNLGLVRWFDVPGLRDHVMASDAVIRRYWSLRKRRTSDPRVDAPLGTSEHLRLMEDAALAWSFFERHIHLDTGIAAGTVSTTPGGRVNSEVTLWDVGSQINAVIAATDLRFIEKQVAADMILKAVGAVPINMLDGGRLPPSNFSARTLRTTVAGFDSCDAGRLGIALSRAVSKGLVTEDEVLGTTKDWALGQAVRVGGHFSNSSGIWQDKSQSHCTDYIIPGFAFFRQKILPMLNWADDTPETEVASLYHAASIGPISTEPFALQAIELGMNGPTKLILDALFDAQLDWFERTGELRCVSEMPLDETPWFVYTGLQLGTEGPEAWVVGTKVNEPTTATLQATSEIVSSKAAYLWKAVYPHPYSDRLVDFVREHARIPGHGFSIGVYSDLMRPVPKYTDINTNGVILSSIAHTLGHR